MVFRSNGNHICMANIVYKKWFLFQVEVKKKCWLGPCNRPNQHIKLHPTNWQYPLINYPVGIQGIVVMETRHTFQIIDKKNILRNVPKSGTCFTFVIDGLLITISGSSFVMKPHERAVRKWKRKPIFEM